MPSGSRSWWGPCCAARAKGTCATRAWSGTRTERPARCTSSVTLSPSPSICRSVRSSSPWCTGSPTTCPTTSSPGRSPGVLTLRNVPLADVICFEVAYDNLVRDAVDGGGRLIVVQTNNATFGRTGETWQQLAMSRLRAVEHGRSAVVVATSGVSALIMPDGRIVDPIAVVHAGRARCQPAAALIPYRGGPGRRRARDGSGGVRGGGSGGCGAPAPDASIGRRRATHPQMGSGAPARTEPSPGGPAR